MVWPHFCAAYSPRNGDPTAVTLQTATLTILTCKMPHYPQLKLVNPPDKLLEHIRTIFSAYYH